MEIQVSPVVSMQTDRYIVLDDVVDQKSFQEIAKLVICEDFDHGVTVNPWNRTWGYTAQPPAATKAEVIPADNENHRHKYTDILAAVFNTVARSYPKYTVPVWDSIRVHAQLCVAGVRTNWHMDKHSLGSFTYYAHPLWRPGWGGELMVCNDPPGDDKTDESPRWYNSAYEDSKVRCGLGTYIAPLPNRLVLLAPRMWHSVVRVDPDCGDNVRVAVVGFLMKDAQKLEDACLTMGRR